MSEAPPAPLPPFSAPRALAEPYVHAHNTFANPREVEPRDGTVNPGTGGAFVYRFAPAPVTRLSITLA